MQTTKTILMFMVAGGLTLFLSYTVGQTSAPVALSERPIRDYPSSEMKSLMKASLLKQKQEIESMSPEARRRLEAEIGGPAWSTELEQALEAGNASMYESKRLAEQYFTTIGEDRKKVAGVRNASIARNVLYDIAKTLKLDPRAEPPPEGVKMDMALLKRELQGTYDGVFLVKPSDGKPLEQYRIVFGVTDGKRCIDKVEKDGDFDAAVYALELEKGQITGWAETVLKGSRANVLSHLPKGEYPYLNAPLLGITGIDVAPCKSSTQPATAAAVSCWKGEIIFSFKPEKSKFDISERLEVEIEKKGNLISVVKCERDEKFAQLMKEKVQVAEFIANYISQPNQRSKWLAKGGDDCLPASMTSMTDRGHTLALGLVDKTRFYGARFANGKSGKVKVFQGVCEVKEGLAASRYCFLVVCTDDKDTPFLMGYAVPDKPQR